MTVCVPDRAISRTLILNSVVAVLSSLQVEPSVTSDMAFDTMSSPGPNKSRGEVQGDTVRSQGKLATMRYLSFLQRLSRSNKISYRAYCLDIITACMAEEWLWSIENDSNPNAITPNASTTGNSSSSSSSVNHSGIRSPSGMEVVASPAPYPEAQITLFAHSLLFMVLHRCNDAAPTVRIRAIGALSGLLGQLKERGHHCPQGMCVSMLHIALGIEGKNKDTEDVSDLESPLNLFDMLRTRIDDSKPLVRAKAIQTFGAALALNWPKVRYTYTNIRMYS
jgi:hypothetical protein